MQNKTRRRAKNALRRVSSQQAASRSADGREAFFQIVQNIVDVLQPHGQADKPRRDARGHKLFVGELAAKDCALFLWITFPCLCEALEVLAAWGFSYKTVAFVWVKQNRRNDDLFTGMGYWTRANAEICILATKGHPKRVDAGVRQVILSHIEEHSKKPDEARERIVRLMGDLPRVELFARQSPEGWDVWGNEVECTAHLPMEETPCCG